MSGSSDRRPLRSGLLLVVATVVLASAVAIGGPGSGIVDSDAHVDDVSERMSEELAASNVSSPTVASQDLAVTTSDTSPSLTEEWTATTAGTPQHSAAAVGAEHVYVGGLDSTVSALYPGNGSVAWTFDRAGSLSDSSPAVAGGTVYVGSGGGEFYALSESDGAVEWTHSTDSAIVSSPTVAGGAVYVGTNDGRVLALNTANGTVEWEREVGAAVYSEPAVADGSVFVTTDEGRVVALDDTSGAEAWTYDTGVELGHTSPTVADGEVYVGADSVYALNSSSGAVEWTGSYDGMTASSPVLDSGTVYVGSAGGVSAFDAETGATQWETSMSAAVETTPVVAGDSVVAAARDGTVSVLGAGTGTETNGMAFDAGVQSSLTGDGSEVYVWTADRTVANLQVGVSGKQPWSDPATWGGEKPSPGDAVEITDGMDVLLDESPPDLAGIHVKGGNLTFARQDLSLTTGYIVVTDGGRLQIGTEDDPFEQAATITLTGTRDDIGSANVPTEHCGVKTVCSLGGKLSIHGAVDGPTWTQLGATAEAGDDTLTLRESVDWNVGDEIVVTSTSYDPALAERRTITAVNGDTVTLNESLAFQHYGEMQFFGPNDEYSLDERAEVMHLTRNVLIQGDEASDTDNFGGHVTAMNEHHAEQMQRAANGEDFLDLWAEMDNDESLVPELEGVEFERMGQEGVMGRYPFHWHTYGDAAGSYLRNSSIHDSYQRCVTIHGTQNATVANNVAYDVIGHCYFLEDGTEWGNEITGNAGALVRSFSSEDRQLIGNDEVPAVYWWSNPNNTISGNVAAGAYGFGFWLDPKVNPTGLTATDQLSLQNPNEERPLEFGPYEDNVAHSTMPVWVQEGVEGLDGGVNDEDHGGMGFFIGDKRTVSDTPEKSLSCGVGISTPARFERSCHITGLTAYYNSGIGVQLKNQHSAMALENSTLADNGLDYWSNRGIEERNVFVGASDNVGNPGQAGQGSVAFGIDGSLHTSVEDIHYYENRMNRSVPAMKHLGSKRDGDEKLGLGGFSWKYDGGLSAHNVFINYYDTEYADRGANKIPANSQQVILWNSTTINADPYRRWGPSHEVHLSSTFIRDYDGTLTGTGEFTEIREWNPNSEDPNPELYFDDSCEGTDTEFVQFCHSRTVLVGGFSLDGNGDYNVTRVSDGVVAADGAGHFPANTTYEVQAPRDEYELGVKLSQTDDRSWIAYKIPMSSPLDTDNMGGVKYDEEDDVAVVNSTDALYDSETRITFYYDEEAEMQYARFRGHSEIDEGWQYPLFEKPFNHYRVEIAPSS